MEFNEVSLKEMLFDVKLVDTVDVAGIPAISEYSKTVIGNIDGQDTILNSCSERYNLIPNSEIFPQIEEVLNLLDVKYKKSYLMSEDRAMFDVSYIVEDDRFIYEPINGDKIALRIAVKHSYNGKLMYNITFGFFRFVCTNGLVIPVQELKQYNLYITGRHTEKINISLNKFKEKMVALLANPENIEQISKMYNVLAAKKVIAPNVKSTIEKVAKATGITLKEKGKSGGTMNYITNIVNQEKEMLNTNVNYWLIYNAFNRYINDNSLNKSNPDKRAAKDEQLLKTMVAMAS